MERLTLGPRVICPSEPAYYIVDCQILARQRLNQMIPTLVLLTGGSIVTFFVLVSEQKPISYDITNKTVSYSKDGMYSYSFRLSNAASSLYTHTICCLPLRFLARTISFLWQLCAAMMSWVGCLLTENSQILLKISVIPIFLTFIYLVALNLSVKNQLNSSSNSTHHCGT